MSRQMLKWPIVVLAASSALFHGWVLYDNSRNLEVPFPSLPIVALLIASLAIVAAALYLPANRK